MRANLFPPCVSRTLHVPRRVYRICTNAGWHKFYVARFNETQHPDAEHLAMLYLFFALRDGEIE